jgi:hypothetical protein
MMAKLKCEATEGLRSAEATITVVDYEGKPQYFPLDRGLLTQGEQGCAIPVRILQFNEAKDLVLINLPVEADSGTQRIWVLAEDLSRIMETVQ